MEVIPTVSAVNILDCISAFGSSEAGNAESTGSLNPYIATDSINSNGINSSGGSINSNGSSSVSVSVSTSGIKC